jgi:transketolase
MAVEPVADKWRAFGWQVQEVDGHDLDALLAALAEADAQTGGPSMIVARTVKGKGVSFFEDKAAYHGVAPDDQELRAALSELGEPADD